MNFKPKLTGTVLLDPLPLLSGWPKVAVALFIVQIVVEACRDGPLARSRLLAALARGLQSSLQQRLQAIVSIHWTRSARWRIVALVQVVISLMKVAVAS